MPTPNPTPDPNFNPNLNPIPKLVLNASCLHVKIIRGQAFWGYLKADKLLHVAV